MLSLCARAIRHDDSAEPTRGWRRRRHRNSRRRRRRGRRAYGPRDGEEAPRRDVGGRCWCRWGVAGVVVGGLSGEGVLDGEFGEDAGDVVAVEGEG